MLYLATLPHRPTTLPPQLAMALVLAAVACSFVFIVSVGGPYVVRDDEVNHLFNDDEYNSTNYHYMQINGLLSGENASCVVPDMGGLEDLRGKSRIIFWRILQSIAIPQVTNQLDGWAMCTNVGTNVGTPAPCRLLTPS